MTRRFSFHRLGRIGYAEALELQKQLIKARIADEIGDTILILEHDPVVTLGRGAKEANVLVSGTELQRRGYEIYEVGRGGDATYHGPGQLVGYPIIDLKPDRKDVRKFVWSLEETMIRTCADYGLSAGRIEGLNGTWIEDRKVGAVGVRISRWVTMHGFALNVNTDLSQFEAIVPCGIHDKEVTSLQRELGGEVSMEGVAERAAEHLATLYDAAVEWRDGPPNDAHP